MAATPRTGWVTAVPAARFEALVCLLRAIVLLFGGAALQLADLPEGSPRPAAVAFHLVVGTASVLAVLPLARTRSADGVRVFAAASTAADVLLYAGYCAAFTGELGLGSLYGVLVLVLGPLRWGLPGVLATGLPVALVAVRWPLLDAAGGSPGLGTVVTLTLLLSVPAAGAATFWQRSGARLSQAQALFQAAFEHASIGMALLDQQLVVQRSNHALSGLLGVPVDELAGSSLADWVDPLDRAAVVAALRRLPSSPHAVRLEVRFARPDGEPRWALLAASWLVGGRGVPPRVVAQVENVTDRKTAEQRLAHQALHDDLTGLPNRSYLRVRLEHALAQGGLPCLLFLDLDGFKGINDTLGHAAGDRLLVEVAARLQSAVRPGDLAARLGGDEFVVLAARVDDAEQAVALGERVLAAVQAPVRVDRQQEVAVGASLGLALAGLTSTPDSLLNDADAAMYQAKSAGGRRLVVFTDDLHDQAQRSRELEDDLRRALEADELGLVYQPVLDLMTGSVVQVEALLRWWHPVHGDVSTECFVDLAEQSGLIDDVGGWALRRAVADAASWPAPAVGPPPCVSVNVSTRQLLATGFPTRVLAALAASGLPAHRLCLEVPESALTGESEQVAPVLRALHETGVALAIDDFGSGHAALAHLAQLPVDVVKVDRTYVAGVADDLACAAVVGGIVATAGAFGRSVVAEGVETQAQLDALRRLGVDRAQGYLLARPMPREALARLLATGTVRPEAGAPEPGLPEAGTTGVGMPGSVPETVVPETVVPEVVVPESVLPRAVVPAVPRQGGRADR